MNESAQSSPLLSSRHTATALTAGLGPRAESGLRIALWSTVVSLASFGGLVYAERRWTVANQITLDDYLNGGTSRIAEHPVSAAVVNGCRASAMPLQLGMLVVFAFGVACFAVTSPRTARVRLLGGAAAACFALLALAGSFRHLALTGLFGEVSLYSHPLYRSSPLAFAIGSGVGGALFVAALYRAARFVGTRWAAAPAAALAAALAWNLGLRIAYHVANRDPFFGESLLDGYLTIVFSGEETLGRGRLWLLAAATASTGALVFFVDHISRPTAHAAAPSLDDPYRRSPGAPASHDAWARTLEGLTRFRTALALRIFAAMFAALVFLAGTRPGASDFTVLAMVVAAFIGCVTTALMARGLFEYTNVPRASGAREGAVLAFVSMMGWLAVESHRFLLVGRVLLNDYANHGVIDEFPQIESVGQVVLLIGALAMVHSLRAVARSRSTELRAPRVGFVVVSMCVMVAGGIAFRIAPVAEWAGHGLGLIGLGAVLLIVAAGSLRAFWVMVRASVSALNAIRTG